MIRVALAGLLVALVLPPVSVSASEHADPVQDARAQEDTDVTPFDQGSSDVDIRITSEIRAAVVERDDLSVNAQNVKIITRDGVVFLRGRVETAAEKATVANIASKTAGVKSVDDELEVERDG